MSGSTNESLMLVERGKLGGLAYETASSRLDMVRVLITSGALGGTASYFGSPEHQAALEEVRKAIGVIREEIAIENANEVSGVDQSILYTGIELIAQERQRQVEKEGWTSEHDDQHSDGQLAGAAACYALDAAGFADAGFVELDHAGFSNIIQVWPFADEWWKPGTGSEIAGQIRSLQKAGALIVAEIDRLQRIEAARLEQEEGD